MITFDDAPRNILYYKLYTHAFCTTEFNHCMHHPWRSFPCPYFYNWSEIGLKDSDELITYFYHYHDIPKENRIFWIGANTHPSRANLVELSKKNPKIIDAQMMEWKYQDNTLIPQNKYVSLQDHIQYKYLIDCPGVGYSARLKWLIATGRPTFVVERDIVEPWFRYAEPFEHYVPVKSDLSDLIEKFQYLEDNPDIYEKISINAKEFAFKNLLLDKQIDRMFSSEI